MPQRTGDPDELNKLLGVDVHEVSLVGDPANKQRFLIIKNVGGGAMSKDKVLGEEVAALVTNLFGAEPGEAVAKALVGIEDVGVQKGVIQALADQYAQAEQEEGAEETGVAKMALSPEAQEQIESLRKANEKQEEEIRKAREMAENERNLRLDREYLEKAGGYKSLPTTPGELGPMLKRLAEVDPELYGKFEGLLGQANTALEKSALLEEFGRREGVPVPASATAEVIQKANELIQKSDGKLSFPDAIVELEKVDPGLYLRYQQEMRGR